MSRLFDWTIEQPYPSQFHIENQPSQPLSLNHVVFIAKSTGHFSHLSLITLQHLAFWTIHYVLKSFSLSFNDPNFSILLSL